MKVPSYLKHFCYSSTFELKDSFLLLHKDNIPADLADFYSYQPGNPKLTSIEISLMEDIYPINPSYSLILVLGWNNKITMDLESVKTLTRSLEAELESIDFDRRDLKLSILDGRDSNLSILNETLFNAHPTKLWLKGEDGSGNELLKWFEYKCDRLRKDRIFKKYKNFVLV